MENQTVQNVLSRLKNVRRTGDCYLARCPSHDDQRNSLSVALGDDGRVLLYCHAGCDIHDVVAAIDLTLKDLFSHD